MEYTVQSLAKLAGISSRTLRYYDEIGLLKPCRVSSSGYRIYGEAEVNLLQQILFYKELELPLIQIRDIVTRKDFDCKKALKDHKNNILQRQKQLQVLLNNVEKTIISLEGEVEMSDTDKFEGFKNEIIKENEDRYGREIREKYGDNAIDKSYGKVSKMSKEEWNEVEALGEKVNEALREAMILGGPTSEKAQEVVKLHKKWLSYFGDYTKEAHIGLGEMYVYDPRFKEFYESRVGKNAAEFLRDSIANYYKN